MRTPTDRFEAWGFWRDWIAGLEPRLTHEPHPGFYKARDGKRQVGVLIDLAQDIDPETGELVGDERLVCYVDGKSRKHADAIWTYIIGPVDQVTYERLLRRPGFAEMPLEPIV